jgi:hypothetical protein
VPEVDTFAARLALIRHTMGWYNVELAARECGVPKESWRHWEKGRSTPRPNLLFVTVRKISKRTGIDFGWIYGGDTMIGETPSDEALGWLGVDTDTDPKEGTA